MMKVIIVDDEPKLRQGLQTLIPWDSLGLTVTATAANGQEALAVIDQERPDIAIVDIRMPLMDGLQLMQSVSSSGLELQVIILSGYADFEYAKQAIKYGVAGYLLKPVDIKEMIHTLTRVRERIEEERLKKGPRQIEGVNQEWLLQSLLVPQDTTEDPAKLRSMAQAAGLLWSSYEVVAVFLSGPEATRPDALQQLADALKPDIERRGTGAVTVIPLTSSCFPRVAARQAAKRAVVPVAAEHFGEFPVRCSHRGSGAGTGRAEHFLYKGPGCVKTGFLQREGTAAGSPSFALSFTGIPASSRRQSGRNNGGIHLPPLLQSGCGKSDDDPAIAGRGGGLFVMQEANEGFVKESFFYLSNAVIHKLTAGSRKEWKGTEEASRFLKGIFEYEHLADLLEETRSFLLALAEDAEPEGKERELKIMINIIHRHYADNLKLDTLAGMLNYSTAYLGQLFKNKTGEYFNTYLDKVRIRKAKELLEQGMKVYEVAERVGYTSVNYFHSKFKKYEGRSPSDFKNP